MADGRRRNSCSVKEMGSGSNLFVVEGYSMAKDIDVGDYIASEEFTMGGCKWVLYFYPNGKSRERNSAHLSLFLSLKSEAEAEAGDIPMRFEFTLMDLSGKANHAVSLYAVNSVPHAFRNGTRMWGINRWFRRAGLETSDFVRDDCLKIYCNMSVRGSEVGRNRNIQDRKSLHQDIFSDPENWEDLGPNIPETMQEEDEGGEEEGEVSKLEKELRKLLLSPDVWSQMEVDTYPKKEAVDNSPLKAATSSSSKSSKLKREHSGEGSKAVGLKKARQENELKRVKDKSVSSSKSPTGAVTEDEIKAFLLGRGGQVTTAYLVAAFKSRLKLKEDKDGFAATLKRIAKIEKVDGLYYLVPR